jgi:hypothetical protein
MVSSQASAIRDSRSPQFGIRDRSDRYLIDEARTISVHGSLVLAEWVGGLAAFTEADQAARSGAQVVVENNLLTTSRRGFGQCGERHWQSDQESPAFELGIEP